jgi:photosystem II stability/assembly factor-like uncharacterized protein
MIDGMNESFAREGRPLRHASRWPDVRGWAVLAFFCLAASTSAPAHANGAFPAPFRLFLPTTRPSDVTVTANFGFITTRDAGKTWAWTCEHDQGNLGASYLQPQSGGRFLGLASGHLISTDNDACDWAVATGFAAGELIDDSFIDPSDSQHVLALGHQGTDTAAISGLFASRNGGTTFGAASLYTTQAGTRLDGVEIPKSNPNRIYLTTSPWRADGSPPRIVRSDDGGKTFAMLPAAAGLAAGTLRIVTVDPADANKIYFRFSGDDDRLLISADGGQTLAVALIAEPGRQLTAFLRRSNGTLLAATFDSEAGSLFRSTDGGANFATLAPNLHVGSIAERDDALYVLADGFNDGFLVGISRDGGDTFESFLDAFGVQGIQACAKDLRQACAVSCLNLENAGLFNPTVCNSLVAPGVVPRDNAGSSGCALGGYRDHRLSDSLLQVLLAILAVTICVRRRHR